MHNWGFFFACLFIFDLLLYILWEKVIAKSQSKSLKQRIWPTVYWVVVIINCLVGGLAYKQNYQRQSKAFDHHQHVQYERVLQPVKLLQQRQNYLLNQMRKYQDNTIRYRQLQIQYYRNNNDLVLAREKLQNYRQAHS